MAEIGPWQGAALAANSTCPACGRAFVCEVSAGAASCWCMRLPPLAAMPTEGGGAACYCPECLSARLGGLPKDAA